MSHYLALWAASRRPLLDLMRVDVRHAPWADLISAGLLVWRPHGRSPWLIAPPGHARRIRPVMGEVDLTAPAWAILADVERAGALIGRQQQEPPTPHRREGWRLLLQDLRLIWQTHARHLSRASQRLARNTDVCAADPDRTARLWRRRHRRAPSLGRFLIPPCCEPIRIPDPWRPRVHP